MIGMAENLGCASGDAACLCTMVNFGFGVRDCSDQSCNNATNAANAVAYANSYCSCELIARAVPNFLTSLAATAGSASTTGSLTAAAVSCPCFAVFFCAYC